MQHSQAEIESLSYDTKPLLRPRQVDEAQNEIKILNEQLVNPMVQDKNSVAKQLGNITKNYNAQVPNAPKEGSIEESRMVARSNYLLEQIIPVMNSQEEMRKCPPGSVDKFRKGENGPRIKPMIAEWKNLQLRLHPGDAEAANLERHRPKTSTLNMDNSTVRTTTYFMSDANTRAVTFTTEQLELIKLIAPDIAAKLATMPNEIRAQIKDVLEGSHDGGMPETTKSATRVVTKLKVKSKSKAKKKAAKKSASKATAKTKPKGLNLT